MRLPDDTPRLRFAPVTDADDDFLVALLNDPDFIRHIGDRQVRDAAGARAWLAAGPRASYEKHGMGLWRVSRKDDDVPLGLCGLVVRAELPGPDLGYAFLPAARGQGIAREAAAATVAHAFGTLGLPRLLAIVTEANTASIRLLESLGLVQVGHHDTGSERLRLHALDADAWRAAQTGVGLR